LRKLEQKSGLEKKKINQSINQSINHKRTENKENLNLVEAKEEERNLGAFKKDFPFRSKRRNKGGPP